MTAFRFASVRLLATVAAAIAPLLAAAQVSYTVDLQETLNGLPLKVEAVPNSGVLVVKVTNNGTTKVRCDVRYDASPQPLSRGYLYVDPGKTEQDAFQAKRRWTSVAVQVTCKPKD
jgi:hypothetical protein